MVRESGSDAPGEPVCGLQLHFVERAACVPLVAGIAGIVSRRYAGIKAHSTLSAAVLEKAENIAGAVVRRGLPVAKTHLGPQLEYVDALACRGLDEMEKFCPDALWRPEEVVADAVAFGRQQAEEVRRRSREQADRIRAIVKVAARSAADSAAAVLSSARDLINHCFNGVDEALDLWISVNVPGHEPYSNNVEASYTLRELTLMTFRKLHTAVCLQFAYERDEFLQVASSAYDYINAAVHNTPSSTNPATTARDHVTAAAQHLLLSLSFLPEKARHAYSTLLGGIMELYNFCTALPIQDHASSSSPSAEESSCSQG